MERWNSLPFILRQMLLGIALFALGAGLSFAYSYRPLHGALTWKVTSLEARLDERNLEYVRLKDELAEIRKQDQSRIEPEALAEVEAELSRTKAALAKSESATKSTDRKRKQANADADRWRKRYETLRDEIRAMPAAKASPPAAPSNDPEPPTTAQHAVTAEPSSSPATPTEPTTPGSPAKSDARALP